MKTPFITALAVVTGLLPGIAMASETSLREWRFDVSVDGRAIGEHSYVLRDRDGGRQLTSEARFRVRILFYDAYRYDHRAEESWRGDCLDRLEARTDADGEKSSITGNRNGGEFKLEAGDTSTALGECVQTFAYWNPTILGATRLLNPQTGEYVPVRVTSLGREDVAGQPAERFRLIGAAASGKPMQIDLWYSPARDWLALESLTPDGRRLRYSRK
jgi:hypothetical protein